MKIIVFLDKEMLFICDFALNFNARLNYTPSVKKMKIDCNDFSAVFTSK